MTTTYSDLSGGPNATPVRFSVGPTTYEIDLVEDERKALDEALAPFVAKARKVTTRRASGSSPTSSRPTPQEVRAWATANGHQVSPKGRVPAEISAAYTAAHA